MDGSGCAEGRGIRVWGIPLIAGGEGGEEEEARWSEEGERERRLHPR